METFPNRYIECPYKSTEKVIGAGAHVYYDFQVHFLYTFSLLGLSVGMSPADIIAKLSNFDISS